MPLVTTGSLAQAELEFARAEAEAKQAAAHQIQTRQINILRQSCQRAGLSRAVEEGLEQVSYCLPDIFDLDEETIEALARVEEDAALQTVCELAEIRGPVVENISVYLKKLMNKVVTQKGERSQAASGIAIQHCTISTIMYDANFPARSSFDAIT